MKPEATSRDFEIGKSDFVIRRQGLAVFVIALFFMSIILYFRITSDLDDKMVVIMSLLAILSATFLYMPVLGANKIGVIRYKFYRPSKSYRWENIINADIEQYESPFANNHSPKAKIVLATENGEEFKIGVDWVRVENLLRLLKKRIPEHRVSTELKSFLETGDIPLNA